MAKIKYSALVSDMRNKLNGSVLSKNRYGSYMRNKVTPVNPQTTAQQEVRQRLGSLSSAWGGLTEAQRSSWRALAPSFPFTDIFGDQKELSGQVLFVKLNSNLMKIGDAINTAAPVKDSIPELFISSLVAEETAGALVGLDLTMSDTAIPVGYELAIYATPPVQPGKQFVKNLYRFIGSTAAITSGAFDAASLWNARFGAVSPGQKIFVRVALVSTASGQQGIPSQAQAAITTAP